jgi:peptidoglycan DL-endopeptidase CwlO
MWPLMRLASLLAVLALAAACFTGTAGGTAQATTTPGNAALDWAENHTIGDPFVFGGTGPAYDCSGLVYTAFRAEGINLPRDTYGMVGSNLLVRTYHPQRGDIAMWGPVSAPNHTGFVTDWPDTAFGAENTGTRVGWYSWRYWPPTAFYRVTR